VKSAQDSNTPQETELWFQDGHGFFEVEADFEESFQNFGFDTPPSSDYSDDPDDFDIEDQKDPSAKPTAPHARRTRKPKGSKQGGARKRGGGNKPTDPVFKYGLLASANLREKQNEYNPKEVIYTRLPDHPMPWSWGHRILTLEEVEALRGGVSEAADIVGPNFPQEMQKHHPEWEGVYITPPWSAWDTTNPDGSPRFTMEDFRKLTTMNQLQSKGIAFIWVPKTFTIDMVKHLEKMSFFWVESANFCLQGPPEQVHDEALSLHEYLQGEPHAVSSEGKGRKPLGDQTPAYLGRAVRNELRSSRQVRLQPH